MAKDCTVGCYYFPNYHPSDARNQLIRGPGWSEWELVKAARPRFPGHHQPNIPAWGHTDESAPAVMACKIDAAAEHGIDAFIFDWYWYDDGPFLERGLDAGFLGAANNHRLKFALMWANHDWIDIHPYTRGCPAKLMYPGAVTPKTFETIGDQVVERYFSHPSYWRIEGRPYFSIYELSKFVASFGSVDAARKALDRFRRRCESVGGLHLNAVVWGQPILPGETQPVDPAALVKQLGFDSVGSYVWIHHVHLPDMATDYLHVQRKYFDYWTEAERTFDVPYYPNVTMGWDSSPRADQSQPYENAGYPFMHTIAHNTPQRFRDALRATRTRLASRPLEDRILTLNCWNEWTEGSYLEPDQRNGMAYLEAVRDAVT